MNKINSTRKKAKIRIRDLLDEMQLPFDQHALYECGIRPVPLDVAKQYSNLLKTPLEGLFPQIKKLLKEADNNMQDLLMRGHLEREMRKKMFTAGLDLTGKKWWVNVKLPTGVRVFREVPSDQMDFLHGALDANQKYAVFDSIHSRIFLNLHNVTSIDVGWEPNAHGALFSDEELLDDFDPFSLELIAYLTNSKEPVSINLDETPGDGDDLSPIQGFFFSADLENDLSEDEHQSLYIEDGDGDLLWLNRKHLCLIEVPLVNVEPSVHRYWLDESEDEAKT